jgi:predicted transcriptional regulator YdeE
MSIRIELPEPQYIVGIQVRTSNAIEANPKTARIPGVWKRFYEAGIEAKIPNKLPNAPVRAVYTDYESDMTGEYTMVVGCEARNLEDVPQGMVGVTIPAAKYDVFPVNGPGSQGLQQTWRDVWSHFSVPAGSRRAYTADFEEYRPAVGGTEAAIYIAVE